MTSLSLEQIAEACPKKVGLWTAMAKHDYKTRAARYKRGVSKEAHILNYLREKYDQEIKASRST